MGVIKDSPSSTPMTFCPRRSSRTNMDSRFVTKSERTIDLHQQQFISEMAMAIGGESAKLIGTLPIATSGGEIPEPAAPQKLKPKPITVPPPLSFKKDNPFLTGGTSLMEQQLDQGWKEWGQVMDEGTRKWDLDKIRQEARRGCKETRNIAEAKANKTFRPWKCYKPKK